MFQFALPHGERHRAPPTARPCPCFNSRSRMGSDASPRCCSPLLAVSIRAPAWGATFVAFDIFTFHSVSIRAPAWGATLLVIGLYLFQAVSIRAPAWGATANGAKFTTTEKFQFALPHGERPVAFLSRRLDKAFQFALPHGERRPLSSSALS